MSIDPEATSIDPRDTSIDPGATSIEPGATSVDPRATSTDPRASTDIYYCAASRPEGSRTFLRKPISGCQGGETLRTFEMSPKTFFGHLKCPKNVKKMSLRFPAFGQMSNKCPCEFRCLGKCPGVVSATCRAVPKCPWSSLVGSGVIEQVWVLTQVHGPLMADIMSHALMARKYATRGTLIRDGGTLRGGRGCFGFERGRAAA